MFGVGASNDFIVTSQTLTFVIVSETDMFSPVVSFIIPVLNGERDIARCLTSIQKQERSAKWYEIIVVDNGSTDRSRAIVRGFGCYLEVLPDVTVAALRNRGAFVACGKYLAFVDADVELSANWLGNAITVFQDVSVVAAGCFPTAPRPATWVQATWEIHQCGNGALTANRPVPWLPSMNLMVRRELFQAIHGFNERLLTAEDVDLCYRLEMYGRIVSVPSMQAVHWGEAPDLKTFWRKEVWRGIGSLCGVIEHGFRKDELPSIIYPLYLVCLLGTLVGYGCFKATTSQPLVMLINVGLLILPAAVLAAKTSWREKRFCALPRLFLLFFVYGMARSYSMIKAVLKELNLVERRRGKLSSNAK